MNKNKIKKITFWAILTLLALAFIKNEIRFARYEKYAQKHNCQWQIINEKEICK